MESVEQMILDEVRKLSADQQTQILALLHQMQARRAVPLALQLMQMPFEQRNQLVMTALARTAHEDIELFEAYEILDDDIN
ncbi:MAG: hypothetical protein H7Y11_12560 [Armatimonadetes bacterium]|nr:hypothetical protein [Anaerolineae bacterium]